MFEDLELDQQLTHPELGRPVTAGATEDELGLIHPIGGHGLLLAGSGTVSLANAAASLQLDVDGTVQVQASSVLLNGLDLMTLLDQLQAKLAELGPTDQPSGPPDPVQTGPIRPDWAGLLAWLSD